MNRNRLAPLATFGLLFAFVLANLAAATGATPVHDVARATGPVLVAADAAPAAQDGLAAVEDEACNRRTIVRLGQTARRAAAAPTPLLATDESIRFDPSVHVAPAPPLVRPLARRAVDVFTIRGPPLG